MWGTVLGAGDTSVKDQKSMLSWSLQCSGETQGTNIAHAMLGGEVCCGGSEAVKGNGVLGGGADASFL